MAKDDLDHRQAEEATSKLHLAEGELSRLGAEKKALKGEVGRLVERLAKITKRPAGAQQEHADARKMIVEECGRERAHRKAVEAMKGSSGAAYCSDFLEGTPGGMEGAVARRSAVPAPAIGCFGNGATPGRGIYFAHKREDRQRVQAKAQVENYRSLVGTHKDCDLWALARVEAEKATMQADLDNLREVLDIHSLDGDFGKEAALYVECEGMRTRMAKLKKENTH